MIRSSYITTSTTAQQEAPTQKLTKQNLNESLILNDSPLCNNQYLQTQDPTSDNKLSLARARIFLILRTELLVRIHDWDRNFCIPTHESE
jgi:hypothetical protein